MRGGRGLGLSFEELQQLVVQKGSLILQGRQRAAREVGGQNGPQCLGLLSSRAEGLRSGRCI